MRQLTVVRAILLSFVLLWVAYRARGAESLALDLNDPDSLEWALNDDPMAGLQWIKTQLIGLDPEVNPRQWIRALRYYLLFLDERSSYDVPEDFGVLPKLDKKTMLEKAQTIAEREGMYEDLYYLKDMLALEIGADQTVELSEVEARKQYEQERAEARLRKSTALEITIMTDYAFKIRYRGQEAESLKILIEAYQILKADPSLSRLQSMLLKTDLAVAMAFHKQNAKAEALQLEIEEFCKGGQLKAYCLTNTYNFAKLLAEQEGEAQTLRAEQYFKQALQLAEQTRALWMQGNIHSGLCLTLNRKGRFQQALSHAERGIAILAKLGEELRLITAYRRGAESLLGLGQFAKALDFIRRASESSAASPVFLNDLEELRYRAYLGLGKSDLALESLGKYMREFKRLAKEREASDYQKLMVSMGLQIEEERNKRLKQENELKNQKLLEAERIKRYTLGLLVLAGIALASMVVAILRSREIHESQRKMQRILDNIDEGILTLNSKLHIESEYSHYLEVLLNTTEDLSGRKAFPLLFDGTHLQGEEKSMVEEVLLTSLGEGPLQWSLNEHVLPSELIFYRQDSERFVAIRWLPLLDSHDRIRRYLITLTDVTERRALESELAHQRQQADRQGQRLAELGASHLGRSHELLQQAAELCELMATRVLDTRLWQQCLRGLHTIKGTARTLGLKELSSSTHEFEDKLQKAHDAGDAPVHEGLAVFREVVLGYLTILSQLSSGMNAEEKGVVSLTQVVDRLVPDLVQRFDEAGLALGGIQFEDWVLKWDRKLLQAVGEALLHAVTNAVDHGFIIPGRHGQTLGPAKFGIIARSHPRGVVVQLRDNGAGLNLPKLKELAEQRGFVPEPGRSVADVVFLAGVSTAEQLTQTSGRGIGTTAIQAICQEWGGEAHIEPNPAGQGTQLEMLFVQLRTMVSASA